MVISILKIINNGVLFVFESFAGFLTNYLLITRAYPALYLGGTPSQKIGTSPPSCLLLENRLYMSLVLQQYCKTVVRVTRL